MEHNGTRLDEPMRFDDPEPIKVPVTIGGKAFVLREASTDVAVKYRNTGTRAAKMVDGKLTGLDGVANVVLVLVQGCLFEVHARNGVDIEGAVAMQYVQSLPYRVTKSLYDRAKAISKGLEDDEDTVESLDKEIVRLTERRDKLAATDGAEGRGVGKDSPTSTTDTSG